MHNLCLHSRHCVVICLHSMHCADSFAGSLILLVIVNMLVIPEASSTGHSATAQQYHKGCLIKGHVCFGRDWKE